MKNVLKGMNVTKRHRASLLLMAISICYFGVSSASRANTSTTNDAAFKNGYNWMDSVIHGGLGTLLASACFIIALIIGIAKQSAMVVVGGVIFALLIAFGPDMVTGIVNSSQIIDSSAMASSSNYMIEWAIVLMCGLSFWFASKNRTNYQFIQMAV